MGREGLIRNPDLLIFRKKADLERKNMLKYVSQTEYFYMAVSTYEH